MRISAAKARITAATKKIRLIVVLKLNPKKLAAQ